VFAFFNAGLALGGSEAGLISAVSIGAFLGLLNGNPIGVAGFVALAVKARLTRLPPGANWQGVIGIGLLAGIGFTMSLFIANLAFTDAATLDQAKIGVLCASVVAALAGLAFLHRALPRTRSATLQTSRADAGELRTRLAQITQVMPRATVMTAVRPYRMSWSRRWDMGTLL
jgi:NhaA family Na+:H+ antiporter